MSAYGLALDKPGMFDLDDHRNDEGRRIFFFLWRLSHQGTHAAGTAIRPAHPHTTHAGLSHAHAALDAHATHARLSHAHAAAKSWLSASAHGSAKPWLTAK